ncbi:MAG: sigma-70 family RNA polymerase sigma factor [Planctomycetales bacterium]
MWPETDETQRLLGEVRDGAAHAVDRLIERHRPALRRLVQARLDRAVQRRVDASDVVQDVLVEAHRRLDDYLRDPRMPFHLWLRHLAQDRIIDMHRRHRAAQRRSVDREQPLHSPQFADRSSLDLAAALRDHELTPAAATIRRELEQRFLAALDELGEDDREIILMRHFEHLGNGEAAAALGISPPAAGMRYLRALRRLRAILGEPPSQSS